MWWAEGGSAGALLSSAVCSLFLTAARTLHEGPIPALLCAEGKEAAGAPRRRSTAASGDSVVAFLEPCGCCSGYCSVTDAQESGRGGR